jgi:protein-S-isoprenylcysteine O-methyltransferase Ste14
MEDVWSHYGQWWAVVLWIVLYGVFLGFVPFYRKSQRKPAGVYAAFVVAFALEMFGVPMSMYAVTWAFGTNLPEGIFWGHTLVQYIGFTGLYLAMVCFVIGGLLVFFGWRDIHRQYWSKEVGRGDLVTHGIYGYVRHPQYTGFLLITLGMLCEWLTIPLLLMWPVLLVVYLRLARVEEADMKAEFGQSYIDYKVKTGMFLPRMRSIGRHAEKA